MIYDIDVTQLAAFTLAPLQLQALVGIASGYLANNLIVAGWWSMIRVRQSAIADRCYRFSCLLSNPRYY